MSEQERPMDSIEEKLCLLESSSDSDMEKYRRLSSNPEYICTACGRVAMREENLCSPERI